MEKRNFFSQHSMSNLFSPLSAARPTEFSPLSTTGGGPLHSPNGNGESGPDRRGEDARAHAGKRASSVKSGQRRVCRACRRASGMCCAEIAVLQTLESGSTWGFLHICVRACLCRPDVGMAVTGASGDEDQGWRFNRGDSDKNLKNSSARRSSVFDWHTRRGLRCAAWF
eukprot:325760-Rhodomonas_salina.3